MTTVIQNWVEEIAALTQPDKIRWIDGSEQDEMNQLLVSHGTFTQLNPEKRPNSFLARTNPADVARVEERTFICSEREQDAGPTNNWRAPAEMRTKLNSLFEGSMRGRTMYVIPFAMGPIGSDMTRYGVELTDSAYVVSSMMIMTRVSDKVIDEINNGADWVPAIHSVGVPLAPGEKDVPWPCAPDDVHVVQFPETKEIWSYGSGYGGNSLLGKKAMSLRIGSTMARDEGWLAEHMLLIRITAPTGKQYNVAAAFPSACGKTNLAMLKPSLPGYKVETIGDDITWIAPSKSGKLKAINPEYGLFGVAPGTGPETNQHALDSMKKNAVFTNVAMTDDGDVWWEGLSDAPDHLTDWLGQDWSPESGTPAAHPNSRFCVPMSQAPTVSPDWESKEGFELDAILFGGRRATNVPLVTESRDWNHGVFMGATIASEQTAAAEGPVGQLRRDPFAMLPFCGYNMADYWNHWLELGGKLSNPPKIFQVNWFRKDENGKIMWPGFSENTRVIDWIIARLENDAKGQATPIGRIPAHDELNIDDLGLDQKTMDKIMAVDADSWLAEADMIEAFFDGFGLALPQEMTRQLHWLRSQLEIKKNNLVSS